MRSKIRLIRAFALAFAVFILLPPFLGKPFPAYASVHWADLFDLLTPIVVIPLYWLLFTNGGRSTPPLPLSLGFMALVAIWAEGQGMHLASNSIGNLMGPGQDAARGLVHFYDEVLSHYLWHFAILGLAALLILSSPRAGAGEAVRWVSIMVWGLAYGLTSSLASLEGGTVPMILPLSALLFLWLLLTRRDGIREDNLLAFLFVGYAVALIVFLGWGIAWGGFPQPSEVGII